MTTRTWKCLGKNCGRIVTTYSATVRKSTARNLCGVCRTKRQQGARLWKAKLRTKKRRALIARNKSRSIDATLAAWDKKIKSGWKQ